MSKRAHMILQNSKLLYVHAHKVSQIPPKLAARRGLSLPYQRILSGLNKSTSCVTMPRSCENLQTKARKSIKYKTPTTVWREVSTSYGKKFERRDEGCTGRHVKFVLYSVTKRRGQHDSRNIVHRRRESLDTCSVNGAPYRREHLERLWEISYIYQLVFKNQSRHMVLIWMKPVKTGMYKRVHSSERRDRAQRDRTSCR